MEEGNVSKILSAIEELKNDLSNFNSKTRSEDISELCSALSKAQAEFEIAMTNKKSPTSLLPYADLAAVVTASRGPLSKYNLSVTQQIVYGDNDMNMLHTILTHESGQWIGSYARIISPKNDMESFGSYIASLRRHTYAALVGVVVESEDDNGDWGDQGYVEDFKKGTKINHNYDAEDESYETITKDQLEELKYELGTHEDLAKDIMKEMKIKTLADLPKSRYIHSIRRVRKIIQSRDGRKSG